MASTGKLEPILAFIASPLYITGLIGNILVIRIVHKTRKMHTTTNFLLVNLAASDVATILFGPLYFTVLLEGYLSNGIGKYVCKLSVLFEICAMASVLSLTVLAVERYHALLKPFRTGLRLNEDNIKQAITAIWVSSTVLGSPTFISREWSESLSTCVGPWTLHMNKATKIYANITSVIVGCIPVLIMFYC